jgi:hypothetical protein
MADYIPVFEPATAITLTASATITGGQLVEVSGNGTVGPAGAATADYVGVAAQDAIAGGRLVVWPRGMVHESTAAGAITAGNLIVAGAAGTVAAAGGTPAAGTVLGVALTTAADAASVRWVAA